MHGYFDGRLCRERRQELGIRPEPFCVSLSPQRSTETLRSWETGRRTPPLDAVVQIAALLDLDPSDLVVSAAVVA